MIIAISFHILATTKEQSFKDDNGLMSERKSNHGFLPKMCPLRLSRALLGGILPVPRLNNINTAHRIQCTTSLFIQIPARVVIPTLREHKGHSEQSVNVLTLLC